MPSIADKNSAKQCQIMAHRQFAVRQKTTTLHLVEGDGVTRHDVVDRKRRSNCLFRMLLEQRPVAIVNDHVENALVEKVANKPRSHESDHEWQPSLVVASALKQNDG